VRISHSVRCVPPGNKPLPVEINTCRQFLVPEIPAMKNLRAILALGAIAHKFGSHHAQAEEEGPCIRAWRAVMARRASRFSPAIIARATTPKYRRAYEAMFDSVVKAAKQAAGL